MGSRASLVVIAGLLAAAAALRIVGFDWDEGQHLHPDERFLTMVETAISLPSSFAEYLDTAHSPLNPANRGYPFFVYGTLPLFSVRLVAEWLGLTDYGHVHFVGRALSAALDVGTVALTCWLGGALGGRRVAVLACALATFSVTSIQNAHFFTVDSAGAFFAMASLCALVRFAVRGSFAAQALFGAFLALAICCRINLAAFGAMYPVVFLYAWRKCGVPLARLALGAAAAAALAAVIVRLVQPYAFAGPGFFDVALAPRFFLSMQEVNAMVTGAMNYPPSVQWIGRTAFFPLKNLLGWGVGPAWGIAAMLGSAQLLTTGWRIDSRELAAARIVVLTGLVFLVYHACQFAPTGRYFLPIIPVLAVAAAWVLGGEARWRTALASLVVVLTALWAIAFTAIYRRPMSRVEASRWMYRELPAGSVIATEHWDDALPLPLPDVRAVPYRTISLALYEEDTPAKRRWLVDDIAECDYIAISSNRLYRSIPREPWRYPLTRRYYEALFSGELGFELARSFTSYPQLGPLVIADDDAEEAFTVYDHPHVLIFRKTAAFSRAKVEELLGAVSLTGRLFVPPRVASVFYRRAKPADIPLPDEKHVRQP